MRLLDPVTGVGMATLATFRVAGSAAIFGGRAIAAAGRKQHEAALKILSAYV